MTTDAVVATFFGHLADKFALASRGRVTSSDLVVRSYRVRVSFAGDALLGEMLPALSHLEVDGNGEPTLRIHAWEGRSGGVTPQAAWPAAAIQTRGAVAGFNTERFRVAYNADSGALSAADLLSGQSYFWTPDLASLQAYEKAAPFRNLLAWSAQAWGGQLAHAGAVASKAGAALVVGPSGSGKSTVALACWGSGLDYLSDDYCIVLPNSQTGFDVASVYATAKLAPDHLQRVRPALAWRPQPAWAQGHSKLILHLHSELKLQNSSARLAAVVVPTIIDQAHCKLMACASADALKALAPSSIFQIPSLGAQAFEFYAGLVARTPCYRLELGSCLADIPLRLHELL